MIVDAAVDEEVEEDEVEDDDVVDVDEVKLDVEVIAEEEEEEVVVATGVADAITLADVAVKSSVRVVHHQVIVVVIVEV